jgi:hypothetical protein
VLAPGGNQDGRGHDDQPFLTCCLI